MPCRDEKSKRICHAFALTERKNYHTLREKSRFVRAKRFALQAYTIERLTAKSAIDNCRAGRAAKGASPFVSTTKSTPLDGVFFRGGKGFAEYLYYQGFTRVSEKRTPKITTPLVERTLPCHLAWQIPFVVFMQAKIPLDGVFFRGGKGFAERLYYQGFTRVSENFASF